MYAMKLTTYPVGGDGVLWEDGGEIHSSSAVRRWSSPRETSDSSTTIDALEPFHGRSCTDKEVP